MVMNLNAAGYSFADFTFVMRKRWTSVVLAGSILLMAGSYLTARKPVNYESVSRLAFSVEEASGPVLRSITDVRPITPDLRKQARLELLSGVLFLKVIDKHGLSQQWGIENRADTLAKMKRMVAVHFHEAEEIVEIIAKDTTPEDAAMLANAIAEEFVNQKKQEAQREAEERVRDLNLELASRQRIIDEMEERLQSLSANSGDDQEKSETLREDLVHQHHLIRSLEARHQLAVVELREAAPPVTILSGAVADEAMPARGRWYLPASLGLLGLAFGFVLVGFLTVRGAPLQVAAELREALDLLFIGFAPVAAAPLTKLHRAADSIVEPYRYLRHRIQKLPTGDCSVIAFLAADPDAELPSVVCNLSVVMAESGKTVLLIDGDLRDPQLYQLFDAANHPGLSDYLTGEMRLEETVVKTRRNNLWFMPSGPPREDPPGLFGGKRMEDLLYEMKSRFDCIFITSPSPLSYTEAAVVSGMVDHTIAVTSYKRHSVKKLKHLKQAVESCGGLLSGIALSQLLVKPPAKPERDAEQQPEHETERPAEGKSNRKPETKPERRSEHQPKRKPEKKPEIEPERKPECKTTPTPPTDATNRGNFTNPAHTVTRPPGNAIRKAPLTPGPGKAFTRLAADDKPRRIESAK